MKQIISGKRFDTDAPGTVEIISQSEGPPRNFVDVISYSSRRFDEKLYRTIRGTWFLAGEGGAMTKYSRWDSQSGSTCGGSKIIPLSTEQAREYLETINSDASVTVIERWFGEVEDA